MYFSLWCVQCFSCLGFKCYKGILSNRFQLPLSRRKKVFWIFLLLGFAANIYKNNALASVFLWSETSCSVSLKLGAFPWPHPRRDACFPPQSASWGGSWGSQEAGEEAEQTWHACTAEVLQPGPATSSDGVHRALFPTPQHCACWQWAGVVEVGI